MPAAGRVLQCRSCSGLEPKLTPTNKTALIRPAAGEEEEEGGTAPTSVDPSDGVISPRGPHAQGVAEVGGSLVTG